MAEDFDKKLVEFTAVLDEFAANQRKQGLDQARSQRLTFVRQIGEGQIVCEMLIDESEDSKSIYEKIARLEGASDRLKAKVDLCKHYGGILDNCNSIEMARKKLAEMIVAADAKRASQSIGRRQLIEVPDAEKAAIRGQHDSIKSCWENIDYYQQLIGDCLRVLGGEDPFVVLADQITKRLDALRGSRSAAAA